MLAELCLPSLSLPLVSANTVSTSFIHCFELCPFPLLPGFNTFPSSSESSEEQENGRIGKAMLGGMVGWQSLKLLGQVMEFLSRS